MTAQTKSAFLPVFGDREPGAALAVLHAGKVLAREFAGEADIGRRIAIGPATRFRIASITKTMVSQAFLTLADTGIIRLDDDIRRWVPELARSGIDPSLGQLLGMKSGLREELSLVDLVTGDYASSTFTRVQCNALSFAQTTKSFPPGTRTLYCNTNYALLQLAMERAAQKAIGVIMRECVFDPCGMATAGFSDRFTTYEPDIACGYRNANGRFEPNDPLWENSAAGAVIATLDDMIAWSTESSPGGRLGNLTERLAQPVYHLDGSPSTYRLGINVQVLSGRTVWTHSGALGGSASQWVFVPADDLGIVILANRCDINWYERAREIAIRLLDLPADPCATPGLVRAVPPPLDWQDDYGSIELGISITLGGCASELDYEGRRMPACAPGEYSRRLGVEPITFRPEWSLVTPQSGGPPDRVGYSEGNVGAMLYRRDAALATTCVWDDYVGRYAAPDVPGSHDVTRVGDGLMLRYGQAWPGSQTFSLRPILQDLFRVVGADGVCHDHHLHFVRDEAGRVTDCDVSVSRITRLRLKRHS